MAVRVLCCPV